MGFLKAFGLALLVGAGCYVAGAAIGMLVVAKFSTNRHDKSVEAAMTAVFVFGPVAAAIGAVVTFIACWAGGE